MPPPYSCNCIGDGRVVHVSQARQGETVVPKHGVDGLRELRAARLVDAARVDPHPLVPVALCELAALPDLLANEVTRIPTLLGEVSGALLLDSPEVLKGLLLPVPDVGERRIAVLDLLGRGEEMELGTIGA